MVGGGPKGASRGEREREREKRVEMEQKRGLHLGFGPLKAVRGARAAVLEEIIANTLLGAG